MIYVQFKNQDQKVIISVFAQHQDDTVWPNQGEVEDDDSRLLEYRKGQVLYSTES